jgi:signal peptidase II
LLFAGLAFFVLVVDQITKFLVVSNMNPNDTIPVIENIFHITFVRNPGAAFGIFPNQTSFFVIVSLIVIIVIIGVYWKLAYRNKIFTVALALQLGGAVGNLIDRLRFTYVVDFFDFRIWPVFNIADMAIVIGVVFLAWQLLVLPEQVGD